MGSVLILFVVPWLDTSPIKSARFRPLYRKFFWLFVISCIVLGWAGGQNPEGVPLILSRIGTVYYFAFFLIIMPLLGKIEKTMPLPKNINIKELNSKKIYNCTYSNGVNINLLSSICFRPSKFTRKTKMGI